jgi:RNA polymerase sigma factor (sigma-70 family)
MDHWDRLIEGLRTGDATAMTDFMRDYRPALERIAAGAIPPGMRRRVGPETVAQSVCRTFLRRMEADPFDVSDADSLWRLLCAIALNKARAKIRFHMRERRGVPRDVPIDAAAGVEDPRSPSPEEAAAFQEMLEQALGELDPEERAILELRLGGSTQEEVAAALGCSERTVRRLLAGLEARLKRRLAG